MNTRQEVIFLVWTIVIFLTAFFMPVNSETLLTAIHSTLDLAQWYAREHIVLLSSPGIFHRRCDCGVCKSRSGVKIFRRKCEEMGFIYRGFHIGRHPCCVFMYHPPVVHKHLQTWCRSWTSHRLSIFRPRHQHPFNNTHCPYSPDWRWDWRA